MITPDYSTEVVEENTTYGKFIIGPLHQSFGHILGNSLRRTLLSSINGAAITQVKIEKVNHIFSLLPGIKETVLEIILNLKTLKFELPTSSQAKIFLEKKGKGKIFAKDFKGEAKVINTDTYLAEITDDKVVFSLEAIVEKGVGFLAAEEQEKKEFGFIPIDASFSPIVKVNYQVEEARVGKKTNFERLILEIWTNESIKPSEALKKSTQILVSYFDYLLSGKDKPKPKVDLLKEQERAKIDNRFAEIIIDELNLPSRVINALLREKIETVADLINISKDRLTKMKGVGKKSITLIKEELNRLGANLKDLEEKIEE